MPQKPRVTRKILIELIQSTANFFRLGGMDNKDELLSNFKEKIDVGSYTPIGEQSIRTLHLIWNDNINRWKILEKKSSGEEFTYPLEENSMKGLFKIYKSLADKTAAYFIIRSV